MRLTLRKGGLCASLLDRGSEVVEEFDRVVPAQAGVGHALAVGEIAAVAEVLTALRQMAFDHQAEDPAFAIADLASDVGDDRALPAEILGTVAVAGVDHQP